MTNYTVWQRVYFLDNAVKSGTWWFWQTLMPDIIVKFAPLCSSGGIRFCLVCYEHFYPRDAMLARLFATATCLSVCPSVTRRYCVQKKKASVMISSPPGSPKILVFWSQISSPNSKGFSPNGASKKGGVWKFSEFLALSVNISKTVADTAKVTISD